MLTDEMIFWGLAGLAMLSFVGAVIFFALDIRDVRRMKKEKSLLPPKEEIGKTTHADMKIKVKKEKPKKQRHTQETKPLAESGLDIPVQEADIPVEEAISKAPLHENEQLQEDKKVHSAKTFSQGFDKDRIDELIGKIKS